MPICKKCGESFPNRILIEDKHRILNSRQYCLKCSPFGSRNTRQIHLNKLDKKIIHPKNICIICKRSKSSIGNVCSSCMVTRFRIKRKIDLIVYKGGKCSLCGYDKIENPSAFHFHHVDKGTKKFNICESNVGKWEKIKEEADKCILVCSRCHAEIEDQENRELKPFLYDFSKGVRPPSPNLYEIECEHCGKKFRQVKETSRYCSSFCSQYGRRKIKERPDKEILLREIGDVGYCAVGRKYGVSDKAIRKWVK